MTAMPAVLLLVGLFLAACATGRTEIDLSVLPPHATEAKQIATIVEVRDMRPFAVDPGDPMLPSLGSEAEVRDPSVTARAVGRKRNAYGMRAGDVMLREDQTVAGLVRGAVVTALREQGYWVVEETAPTAGGYEQVLRLAVDVERFWAWFDPGLIEVTLEFESRLRLYGGALLPYNPVQVNARSAVTTPLAWHSTWRRVIRQGLDALTLAVKDHLKAASPAGGPVAQLPPEAAPLVTP